MTINGTLATHRYSLIVKVNASNTPHFLYKRALLFSESLILLLLIECTHPTVYDAIVHASILTDSSCAKSVFSYAGCKHYICKLL